MTHSRATSRARGTVVGVVAHAPTLGQGRSTIERSSARRTRQRSQRGRALRSVLLPAREVDLVLDLAVERDDGLVDVALEFAQRLVDCVVRSEDRTGVLEAAQSHGDARRAVDQIERDPLLVLALEFVHPLAVTREGRLALGHHLVPRSAGIDLLDQEEWVELLRQLEQLLVGAVMRPQLDALDDLAWLDAGLAEELEVALKRVDPRLEVSGEEI